MTRKILLTSSAAAIALSLAHSARAQSADAGGLEEIIVTAQKREQSLQDVPIAVTAITQEALQANRIYSVTDLSALAPGLTVKPSAAGVQVPTFTMRGQVSYGVVPGSDKQVSIYVDGVYIGAPRGSIFEMPDIQRLEVLRGPQGTLFGRNATAGAISVTTRDPSGDARVRVEGTLGNYDAYRVRATVETPEFGPFSAYFSYVRNYRRGEIRNAAAGLVWDRTNSPSGYGKSVSPRWLGTVDSNAYFAAVKFEPTDNFRMVYKFDRNDDSGTPGGVGALNFNTKLTGNFLTDGILAAIAATNNLYLAPDGKRPDVVTNGFTIPRQQRVQGHSVTATWNASDSVTVKNILAYRKASLFATSPLDGVSSLNITPAVQTAIGTLFAVSTPAAQGGVGAAFFTFPTATQTTIANQFAAGAGVVPGSRIVLVGSQSGSVGSQWSNETQINYSSEKLQATLGGIWFHSSDEAGGPIGQQGTLAYRFGTAGIIPSTGIIPLGNSGRSFNKATSWAGYAQLEYKLSPELEIVGGARITHDRKTGSFVWDIAGVPQTTINPPVYSRTKPNFLVGLNWSPDDDTLVYGKWSNSFVSGGSVSGIAFEPETASSFEVGLKADFLDKRLRTNLALFHVTYNHHQSPGSTSNAASRASARLQLNSLYLGTLGAAGIEGLLSSLATFVNDQGQVRAQGFELEVTAAPTRGLTLGGSVGYTDTKFTEINPVMLAGLVSPGSPGGRLDVTARPEWTVSLFGAYETEPLVGDTTLQFRADGQYRSAIKFQQNPELFLLPDNSNAAGLGTSGFMMVNGRIALRHINVGPVEAELALWGKNLTNRKDATFGLGVGYSSSLEYLPPRTFGVDLNIDF